MEQILMGEFGGNCETCLTIRKSKGKRFRILQTCSKQDECVGEFSRKELPVAIYELGDKVTLCLVFSYNVSVDKYL
jgi:hypothetical protein